MRTAELFIKPFEPLSGSDVSKDLLLLDVAPLSLPEVSLDVRAADVDAPRKDSGEAHLDYLKVTMLSLEHTAVLPNSFVDVSGHRITGTDQSEIIYGIDTRDVIEAGRGNDTVYAGDGNDAVFGGKGHDWIELGDGDDIAYGGLGNDVIIGGNGNDLLSGGPGNDILHAGEDGWLNILNGGRDHDTMTGSTHIGVTDIFQFTEAEDAPAPGAWDMMDQINNFRDGEDLIWLVFDANAYEPGHQGFEFVAEEDAGEAGTIWLDTTSAFNAGAEALLTVILRGHTDNDGTEDFFFKVHMRVDADDVDVEAADVGYQVLTADDFIFG